MWRKRDVRRAGLCSACRRIDLRFCCTATGADIGTGRLDADGVRKPGRGSGHVNVGLEVGSAVSPHFVAMPCNALDLALLPEDAEQEGDLGGGVVENKADEEGHEDEDHHDLNDGPHCGVEGGVVAAKHDEAREGEGDGQRGADKVHVVEVVLNVRPLQVNQGDVGQHAQDAQHGLLLGRLGQVDHNPEGELAGQHQQLPPKLLLLVVLEEEAKQVQSTLELLCGAGQVQLQHDPGIGSLVGARCKLRHLLLVDHPLEALPVAQDLSAAEEECGKEHGDADDVDDDGGDTERQQLHMLVVR
mmetsp:Transcript_16721/g.46720  ORF Transcript_16721/g.46720 Transcript_16721/m.46720 type:complete len:301 (-) Transcript_16721:6236-7138(-)